MNAKQWAALKQIRRIVAPLARSESLELLAELRKVVNNKPDDGKFPGQKCHQCQTEIINIEGDCPKCDRLALKDRSRSIRVGQISVP